jgi:hypothetical protein
LHLKKEFLTNEKKNYFATGLLCQRSDSGRSQKIRSDHSLHKKQTKVMVERQDTILINHVGKMEHLSSNYGLVDPYLRIGHVVPCHPKKSHCCMGVRGVITHVYPSDLFLKSKVTTEEIHSEQSRQAKWRQRF